ncbi:MAG: glycosyltransferase family 2 protein [Candidatus Eremiobacteraeota bacterium]|nr:glycosyltransferase family 2 protein [Candidatus Eremiobacteraeota bacterium]
MSMTITTVIPTYRRPALLRRAIESVLAQSYQDVQVRVYDNASGDTTTREVADIAARDARVTLVRRAENIGAAENFIRAFDDVSTPLCSFLSDDDYVLPGFFARAVSALDENPGAGFFAGSTLEHDVEGGVRFAPLLSWPREGRYEPSESVLRMLGNKHPTWTGVVFRTQALRAAGGFDRAAAAVLDVDVELRVAARAPIVVSFAPCAVYTTHADSVLANQTAAVAAGYERVLENIDAVPTLSPEVKRRFDARWRRQLRLKLVEIAVKSQVRGDAAAAQEAARELCDRYGSRWLGGALAALLGTCARLPAAQSLLRRFEARRVEARAAHARDQVAISEERRRPA